MHTRPHVLLAYRFPWKGKHCFLYGLYMYRSYVLLDGVETATIWKNPALYTLGSNTRVFCFLGKHGFLPL